MTAGGRHLRRGATAARLAGAALILWAALVMPDRPADLRPDAVLRLPLELPLALLALALVRGAAFAALRFTLTAAAAVLIFLRLADLGTFVAFDRRFNPLLDLHVLTDGWILLSQSVGRAEAMLAVATALAALAAVTWCLYACLGAVRRVPRVPLAAGMAGVAALGALMLAGTATTGRDLRVQAALAGDLAARARALRAAVANLAAFGPALHDDPLADGAPPDFAALAGRDVILVFVESYGRSFLEAPRFTDAATRRLSAVQSRLAEAGLAARSGWLSSPVRGGESWLAHATFLSGLTIDNQPRYDRLITSDRPSLNRLFARAGWRTAAVMPAITMAWPEAGWFGYDRVLDAAALDYAGEPFEWVTMPDQYTLAAFQEKLRAAAERPVMAEMALISSHAPWTPLPERLPWAAIGDGAVFDGTHRSGAAPAEVWAEPARIRAQYAKSLDYTLDVLGRYIARHGDETLFVVLGDHQPVPLVTGEGASDDVPVHLIADDPDLLARLDGRFWSRGMIPAGDLPARDMARGRGLVAERFSGRDVAGDPGG